MAGSPGAGKTESSIEITNMFTSSGIDFCLIEQDYLKTFFPNYDPELSERYHSGANLAIEKVIDDVLKKGFSFILDSTLYNFEKTKSNIERCLKKGYGVSVIYVYQSPKLA